MSKAQELTPILQSRLDHLQRAQAQAMSLVEYSRSAGIKVNQLYDARWRLARKGLLAKHSSGEASPERTEKTGEFIAVRVASAATPVAEIVCRLRHPSGWVIECAHWPQATWLAEIFRGGFYAAS
jgi:hypothetical protein